MNTKAKARVVVESSDAHVYVKPENLYDLEAIQSLQAAVLGKLGCPGCTSGFNVLFRVEENEFAVGG